ncbi:MAG TPA: MBL fold metallo-hydrolase [Gemmatimonadaceae bacterium]|jgi:glyoxylase-like metal-dependent hydrolase (beta-lactamase superfamily II)|nr:MBL fold metallo-hydrolase [Gemmatimonadaceae bacterium]
MILRQYLHVQPVVAVSYVFGCGGQQAGAVVDPVEPPEFYIDAADALGLHLHYVIDTHVHADHRSTGRALAEASGASYVLHAGADAAFAFRGVHDGERLELGNVVAEVMHVPGHTPEHLALVVTDHTRAPEPWMAFTGHTLMVGDMGRTELASAPEEGARALFDSAQRLAALPDYVEVFPGAFSGSVCGRGLSGKASSTIGFERRFNRALGLDDRETFVARMLHDIPPRPPDAERMRSANLGRAVEALHAVM